MRSLEHLEIPASHDEAVEEGFGEVAIAAEREFAVLMEEFKQEKLNIIQVVQYAFMHGVLWSRVSSSREAVNAYCKWYNGQLKAQAGQEEEKQ